MSAHRLNRRNYERSSVAEVAMLHRESGRSLRGVLTDVGLGGVQLRVREALVPGDDFRVALGRDAAEPMDIPAIVRYCVEVEGSCAFSAGLEFHPESDEQRIEIGKYVRKVLDRYMRALARPVLNLREAN